jgi:DNA-binding response OmpR family regulator
MHVLIADDDPVYRTFLEDLLGQWKFEVTAVCDGAEAWEAVQRDEMINLAVLDWVMPRMDGHEVCRKLKEDLGRDVYTILVTGSRLKDEVIKVLVSGADDYIAKPFDAVDLKIHVRTAVRIVSLEAEVAELRKSLQDQGLNVETAPKLDPVFPIEQRR